MKKRNKNSGVSFVHGFHCSGKSGIRGHSMRYKWCNFSDSTPELNALIFAFTTDIAHYKDGQ